MSDDLDDYTKMYFTLKGDILALELLLKECRDIIYVLTDDEPCKYDHHGFCQTHGWLSTGKCPNKRGKELITKIDNAIGEKK